MRSSPACRTERKRSPEQPGPKGNAQPMENCRFRLKSCRSAGESCDRLDDPAVRRVAAAVVYRGGIICNWTFNEALDSKIDDLVVVADSGVHSQQQATNLFR